MTEFEIKLEIPPDSLKGVVAAVRAQKVSRQHLLACYYDTADGALAPHALVLRVRKEGQRWVQTAKGPSTGKLERLEHNVNLAKPADGAPPTVDLARHMGTPVGGKILQALGLKTGDALPKLAPLLPLYVTDVVRLKRNVELAGSVMEIALDQGRIVAGTHSVAVCELEVELLQGQPEHAIALAREWCVAHGLWLSTISKSMKGQRLMSGQPFGPAIGATAPQFQRHANAHQISTAILHSCISQAVANASEIASGSNEQEHVHQLRIGLRRLRTALRAVAPLAQGIDPAWLAPLVAAFRALGYQRDHNYLLETLQPQLEAAGGPVVYYSGADAGAGADVPDPLAIVRAIAFQDALLQLIGFAHTAEPLPGKRSANSKANSKDTHKTACKIIQTQLKKLHTQVVKDGKNFLALAPPRQHQVRKRLKRLRYLAEFVTPLYATARCKAYIAALKPVLDVLGLYNDEIKALDTYQKLASQHSKAWFAMGWLTARRNANATACQQALRALDKAKPFWE
jgi:triphosphatase